MLQDYLDAVWSKWSYSDEFISLSTLHVPITKDDRTLKDRIQQQLKVGMVPICFGHTIEYIQHKYPEYFI